MMSFFSKTLSFTAALFAMTALNVIGQTKSDTTKILPKPQDKKYGDITIHADLSPAFNIALKAPYKKAGYIHLSYGSKSVSKDFRKNLHLIAKDGLNNKPDGMITPDEVVSFEINNFNRRFDYQTHIRGTRRKNTVFGIKAHTESIIEPDERLEATYTTTQLDQRCLKEFLPYVKTYLTP